MGKITSKALELLASCETGEEFYKEIPRDIADNIEFRKDLHQVLCDHPELVAGFKSWCTVKKQIVFDTCLWTYNPRKKPGYQNRPFILRPKQIKLVESLCDSIDNSHDLIIDKSREEGATEVITKLFTVYWLLHDQVYFLIGSRKEDLVDKSTMIKGTRVIGSHQTLFHKVMYAIANLPIWWKVEYQKSHCFLQNLENSSVIEGEATNDSFGAGNRATAVLVDEMARIEPKTAQYISDNIRDTTDVAIFNSTHFQWGAGHPYAKLLNNNKIQKFVLGWEHNPIKNVGLYKSPAKDMVIIEDIDYYRSKSKVFNDIEAGEMFNWPELKMENHDELEDIRFISDGGVSNFGCQRSLWFDAETVDRSRSMTDVAQNILRIPQGSADMFFGSRMISIYKNKFYEEPSWTGRLNIIERNNKIETVQLREHLDYTIRIYADLKKLNGDLVLNPRHHYIVSCDISRGTGASNSVLSIIDVNECKLVGIYVNAYIDVVDFAELAVGISRWAYNAYLIWEANGPGDTFGKRVLRQGYHNIYWNKDERAETRATSKKPGWYSTQGPNGTKFAVLNGLDAGMAEALKVERNYHYLEIPDDKVLSEMMNYIFAEGKTDVLSTDEIGETSSEGKFAHGDRVISVSLGFFALKYQPKKNFREERIPPRESFQYRFMQALKRKREKNYNIRQYRYN